MTETPEKNGFVQKLALAIISGAVLAFFGWLSYAVVGIQVVSGRMDERMVAMDAKITLLVNAKATADTIRMQTNTRRIEEIQNTIGE